MSDSRPSTRTRRARLIVVTSSDAMRELATALRRRVAYVIEVASAFDAVGECHKARSTEPIAGVILSPECELYDPAAFINAFERVDPAVPLLLAVSAADEDSTAAAIREGFEHSIRLPPREDELLRVLEDLDMLDAPQPMRPSIPHPKNEVLLDAVVERAQEHFRHDPKESHAPHPMPAAASIASSASASSAAASSPSPSLNPAVNPALNPSLSSRSTTSTGRPAFQMPVAPRRSHDQPADAPPSDLDLVRAVTTGHDVQGAAMRVLRHHLGSADVRFVAESRPGEDVASDTDRRGLRQVVVGRTDGRPYGVLLSRSIDEDCLLAWATWLSAWLDLDENHQELRRLTWSDELTGAGNRRAFDRLLHDSIKSAQQDWRYFGLMLFDIDDFKRYNDEHGHDIGDEVLKEIVLLLHSCIRRGDRCFRIGGDEFAVLFSDPEGPRRGGVLDRETATMIASRFQRAVSDLNLSHIGLEGPGTISVSTGFAAFPWHGLEPITLYRAADGFCLESKRAGKNRITFGPGMQELDQPKS